MNKLEFINALGEKLSALPTQEVQGILDYYVESVDDRMEDGMTEAEAIESLGTIDELAEKILSEQAEQAPPEPVSVVYEPPKKRRISPAVIVLLVLGSPIWVSLAASAFAAFLGLYIAAWAVLGSLFVAAGSFILAGIVSAPFSFFVAVTPNTIAIRILCFGMCLGLAGLGLLLLPGCLWLIRAFLRLHRWVFRKITRKGAKK